MESPAPPTSAPSRTTLSRFRWYVCALLFAATTINYLDRIVFSVLIPVIRQEMHISDLHYGYINGAFQAAYTVGFIFMGGFFFSLLSLTFYHQYFYVF